MSPFQHQETIRQEKETEMNTRKFLTLASVVTVLLAPAAFYAATGAQRSSGFAEPDTMATEFLWIPNHIQAIGLGEPDTMATEFVWTPKEPDTMATEFLWIPKHVSWYAPDRPRIHTVRRKLRPAGRPRP